MDICLWQFGVQPELPTFILGFLTFFFFVYPCFGPGREEPKQVGRESSHHRKESSYKERGSPQIGKRSRSICGKSGIGSIPSQLGRNAWLSTNFATTYCPWPTHLIYSNEPFFVA